MYVLHQSWLWFCIYLYDSRFLIRNVNTAKLELNFVAVILQIKNPKKEKYVKFSSWLCLFEFKKNLIFDFLEFCYIYFEGRSL